MTDRSRETARRRAAAYALLGPGLASLAVVALLGPSRVVSSAMPLGIDLGGHLYPIAYWIEHWLSQGRLLGWSPGWYGGFPLYYFYFPLPAGLVAVASVLLPLAAALKVVAVLGSLLLPWGIWFLARAGGLSPRSAAITALVGSTVLLMESHWHLGGNLYSTLVGEFSFAWAVLFALLYVGVLTRTLADGRPRPVAAAIVLALTALSHLIPTILAVLTSAISLVRRGVRRTILISWGLGFLLAGAWAIPLLARLPYMARTEWELPPWGESVLPLELLPYLLLGIGGAWVAARRGPQWIPLLAFTVVGPVLALLPLLPMGDRVLASWALGLHVLSGVVIGALVSNVRGSRGPLALTGVLLAVLVLGGWIALRNPSTVRDYAREVLEGYPAAPAADEFGALVDDLRALPPGRVTWQTDSAAVRFGRSFALDVLPYLDPAHPTLPGLLRESSRTQPFVDVTFRETSPRPSLRFPVLDDRYAFDFDRGVWHMELLGVRYFVAFTDDVRARATAHGALLSRVERPGYGIYELTGWSPVEVARAGPDAVDRGSFEEAARGWFERASPGDAWLVATDDGGTLGSGPLSEALPDVDTRAVTDYAEDARTVRFRTEAVGRPHLVKTSFFPNWTATGAQGPWLAAPNWMLVVPTRRQVELRFRYTRVEWVGWLATLAGLAVLTVAARRGAAYRASNGLLLPHAADGSHPASKRSHQDARGQ